MAHDDDTQKLKDQFKYAQDKRRTIEAEISQCYLYTYPAREFVMRQQGQQPDRTHIYDSTATDAVEDLATTIMTLLIPQNSEWAGIALKEGALNDDSLLDEELVEEQIASSNRILFEHFESSNFYLQAGESMLDCIIAGTGCLAVYEGNMGVKYMGIPIQQLYFTENLDGEPDTVFREHKETLKEISKRWPRIPEEYDVEANPNELQTLIEVQYADPIGGYRYCVYLGDDWHRLEENYSSFKTFHPFRWSKTTGETYGESPVRKTLSTIRSVNKMAQLIEVHGEFAAYGLWQTAGAVGEDWAKHFKPGGLVPNLGQDKIEPIIFPGQFSIAPAMLSQGQESVRRGLFNTKVPNTQPGQTPVSSAEIYARQAEFFARMGEPALRLAKEFLEPVMKTVIGRLQRRQEIPFVTDEYIRSMGDPKLQQQSDLFTIVCRAAVKRVRKLAEAQQTIQAIQATISTVGEEALWTHANKDEITRHLLEASGLARNFLNSPATVKAIKDQLAQQAKLAQVGQGTQLAQQFQEVAKNQKELNE